MSKKETLTRLLWEVNEEMAIGNKYWRRVMSDIQTLNEFKSSVEWTINHVDCCAKQLHKHVQYHHGNPYYYHPCDLNEMRDACYDICKVMGYEIYSPNGAWFVRSIK